MVNLRMRPSKHLKRVSIKIPSISKNSSRLASPVFKEVSGNHSCGGRSKKYRMRELFSSDGGRTTTAGSVGGCKWLAVLVIMLVVYSISIDFDRPAASSFSRSILKKTDRLDSTSHACYGYLLAWYNSRLLCRWMVFTPQGRRHHGWSVSNSSTTKTR